MVGYSMDPTTTMTTITAWQSDGWLVVGDAPLLDGLLNLSAMEIHPIGSHLNSINSVMLSRLAVLCSTPFKPWCNSLKHSIADPGLVNHQKFKSTSWPRRIYLCSYGHLRTITLGWSLLSHLFGYAWSNRLFAGDHPWDGPTNTATTDASPTENRRQRELAGHLSTTEHPKCPNSCRYPILLLLDDEWSSRMMNRIYWEWFKM